MSVMLTSDEGLGASTLKTGPSASPRNSTEPKPNVSPRLKVPHSCLLPDAPDTGDAPWRRIRPSRHQPTRAISLRRAPRARSWGTAGGCEGVAAPVSTAPPRKWSRQRMLMICSLAAALRHTTIRNDQSPSARFPASRRCSWRFKTVSSYPVDRVLRRELRRRNARCGRGNRIKVTSDSELPSAERVVAASPHRSMGSGRTELYCGMPPHRMPIPDTDVLVDVRVGIGAVGPSSQPLYVVW